MIIRPTETYISMYSSSVQKLVICFLFHRSFIACGSISTRGLPSPATVLGEVHCYEWDEANKALAVESRTYQVPLQDLRREKTPDLETDGFTYVSGRHVAGLENIVELSDEHQSDLEADSLALVKDLTKARMASVYTSTFRDHTSQESVRPVSTIHSDLSPKGARHIKNGIRDLFLKSKYSAEYLLGKKLRDGQDIVILNVWRPIRPVEDNHLGICKWGSLVKEDALEMDIKPTNGANSLQAWRYREGQEWYYISNQQPDQVYVFMQHDDRAKEDGHGINVPHASFNLQGHNKPPTRMSFEAKIIAVIDRPTVVSPPALGRLAKLKNSVKSIF